MPQRLNELFDHTGTLDLSNNYFLRSLARKQLDKIYNTNKRVAKDLLDDYRHQMEQHGIALENIECITNIQRATDNEQIAVATVHNHRAFFAHRRPLP